MDKITASNSIIMGRVLVTEDVITYGLQNATITAIIMYIYGGQPRHIFIIILLILYAQ